MSLVLETNFHRRLNLNDVPKLTLLNHELNHVENCKYLGINIYYKLNMDVFVTHMKNQVLHKIYVLTRARKFLTLAASITVFKSMLLPFFEYGNVFSRNL